MKYTLPFLLFSNFMSMPVNQAQPLISDVPSIISGDKIAFLEPQEEIWKGESGRLFSLQKLAHSDHLTSLNGIAGFNSQRTTPYSETIFRFPLRKVRSGLSENVYTLEKVNQLINALRSEAKLLLLFLRSIHTIEVYNIDQRGRQTLSFRTKIADASVEDIVQKRATLLEDLKSCHVFHPFKISKVIEFTAKFDVCVYDANTGQTTTSQWLVANQVGSTNATVGEASVKQKVFPWVGTAVELGKPGNGRIFTVLPMPIETASKLPVHVNGTFGLNDDRRSLKWPGTERRNDNMANWNSGLVRDVIPSCYVSLLLEYRRHSSVKFYEIWPQVSSLTGTQWEPLLTPVFNDIFRESVILCEETRSYVWARTRNATCCPRSSTLTKIVRTTLIACGLKLANIPDNVWDAFDYVEESVSEVSPEFVRDNLRASPDSYASISCQDKKELLSYCLSDDYYSDLEGLKLLPLANGTFVKFEEFGDRVSVCTSECPRELLPNFDHKLVDLTTESDLNAKVEQVAQSNNTQLRLLTDGSVATLIDEALSMWRHKSAVTFPDSSFPSDWFQKFWKWVKNKNLALFLNKLIFPVLYDAKIPSYRKFKVIRLAAAQAALYIPYNSDFSATMQSVLDKFGVQYCTQSSFPFVKHAKLTNYIKQLSPNAILEVISIKRTYNSVELTSQEADTLRQEFSQVNLSAQNHAILRRLKIFSTCANTSSHLYSIDEASQTSLLRGVVVKPSETIDVSVLPSKVILFSSDDYFQNCLLRNLGFTASKNAHFLTEHLFPNIHSFGDRYIDTIMLEVLQSLKQNRDYSVISAVQNLRFVKVTSGSRKCPYELFDPGSNPVNQIFSGEAVFPCAPYDKHLNILRCCGLRTSIKPQEILDVIYSISLPARSYPQAVDKVKMIRAKAIMKYVTSCAFDSPTIGTYRILNQRIRVRSFSAALKKLSDSRSWLPVMAERPSCYPSCLPWLGSACISHFVALNDSVCVASSVSPSLPLLCGSKVYFTEAFDSVKTDEPKRHIVAHFQEVMACKDDLEPDEMAGVVGELYSAMSKIIQYWDIDEYGDEVLVNCHQSLQPLREVNEWVYIRKMHKFVSIDSVALNQNPKFRHNIEPYLHILPDSISRYSQLFQYFGMEETITSLQIVSILGLIKDDEDTRQLVSPEDAWSTVMSILNWVTKDGTTKVDGDLTIYVPAEINTTDTDSDDSDFESSYEDSSWPVLREPSELVYTDNEFLKKFDSTDEDSLPLTFVHRRINQSLAKCLHITPLSEELDIAEDTFEDAGQEESLIVRIKNILREYKNEKGLTIIKELIQNADDARATEVNICFDARDLTSIKQSKLYYPEMRMAHGPALIVQNNSTFSDKDFENIQKLAGATKQDSKHLKIGKFGIGFCSVYHITDVPSFISRDRLYIFDPTLKHLKKAVKNPARAGQRVKYLSKAIQRSKQMEPYRGLFGFTGNTEYNATMFRLPFRTVASELSNTCFAKSNFAGQLWSNEFTFEELLETIEECGDGLLLFLRNVRRITVQRFDNGEASPNVLYTLTKNSPFIGLSCNLVNVEETKKSEGKTSSWLVSEHSTTHQSKPAVANVACSLIGADLYHVNDSLEGEMFCFLPLSQHTGLPVHVSCNFAVLNNRRGIWTSSSHASTVYNPEAEWNVHLMKHVVPVAYINLLGSLKGIFDENTLVDYRFFSLWPLTSKLHQLNPWEECVRSLYTTLEEKENSSVIAASTAYQEDMAYQLLEAEEEMDCQCPKAEGMVYLLSEAEESPADVCYEEWPAETAVSYQQHFIADTVMDYQLPVNTGLQAKSCFEVSSSEELTSGEEEEVNPTVVNTIELFYSESTLKWLSCEESRFLDSNVLCQSSTAGDLQCVLDVIHHLKLPLVNLPSQYRSHLNLTHEGLTEEDFVENYFSNLTQLKAIRNSSNEVILHMLETYASQYDDQTKLCEVFKEYFDRYACMPTRPDASVLRKCGDLVDPRATFAKLFDETDHRFPISLLSSRDFAMTALRHAGMMHSSLPWDLVIDRAQSVIALFETEPLKALERVKLLLNTISSMSSAEMPSDHDISAIEFLPVMKKPKGYPLSWYGDSYQLLSGKKLVLSGNYSSLSQSYNYIRIAGSQTGFLCEEVPDKGGCGRVYYTTRNLLGLRASPSLTEVVSHLKAVIDQCSSSDKPDPKWTSETCKDIYHFIDNELGQDSEVNLSELQDVACIWNEEQFLDVDSVAISWKMSHGPYLFKAPPALASMKKLSTALQIRDSFTSQDAVNALQKMKSKFEDEPIDEPCTKLVTELVSIFNSEPDGDTGSTVYLPDTNGVLHKSSHLVYNDAKWAPLNSCQLEVSAEFPRKLAVRLGVQPVRSKMLEKYVSKAAIQFRPFGQHEELTTRIRNIINCYPFDITVLKELLQNADDAKAKKMYVILDKRTHGKKSVISEKWEELQGPAMLVWNDSVFTEKNLEGIQELGFGSKSTESDSIGQYGIGFNVVYHITDCPSFVTKDGDTLCFMDPHCKYVPESADSEHSLPGGRYDDLNTDFWKKFSDMSTAYLQDNLKHSSQTFKDGTLFRFPIRHSKAMMQSSKIVKDINSEPLSPGGLAEKLMTWMPDMKKAMLFLNHVNEIKYIEIDTQHKLETKFHFKAEIEKSKNYGRSFKELRDAISSFSESSGYKSCVIHYPLTVTQVGSDHKQVKWLVQQGIGDIHDKDQTWQSDIVLTVKPRHGIAAALQPQMSYNERKKEGQLFCFLPLPEASNMPVHINGCFMLDSSSRRSLWKSTDPGVQDYKCHWNDSLKKAIASSYADFLVNAKKRFLHASYKGWKQALDDLSNYYSLFPKFSIVRHTKWDTLQCSVYKHLLQDNAEVLCVFTTSKKGSNLKILVEWHPLLSEKLVDQVHYWAGTSSDSERKIIHPILESLGLKVSSVPADIMDCFNRISKKLYKENHLQGCISESMVREYSEPAISARVYSEPAQASFEVARDVSEEHLSPSRDDSEGHRSIPCISSTSAFKYYTKHSQFSSTQGMLPCPIQKTVFKNLENFLVFTKYLLKCPLATDPKVSDKVGFYEDGSVLHVESDASITTRKFPDSPFTHFLLLSADGMLRKFDNNHKILNSEYSTLFPNHLDVFLHPALINIRFDSSYFMSSDGEDMDDEDKKNNLRLIFDVFKGTFPQEMDGACIVMDAPTVINKTKLAIYWDCFRQFEVFSSYLPEILKHWAFLYTTDNRLYSTSNAVLPSYIPSEPDDLERRVRCIMMGLQMPFLDSTVVTADVDCPKLSEHGKMLKSFYHTNVNIPGSLTAVIKQTKHMDTLIDYFSRNSSPGNPKWVKQISSLPFFEDVEGTYSPIVGKKVYLWPSSACSAGYNCWASDGVLFVRAEAKWTNLASAKQLSIHTISAEKLYMEYIFPKFYRLEETDRYLHLEHIRRELFSVNLNYSNLTDCSSSQLQMIHNAYDFIAALKALKWIRKGYSFLQPISAFSDPTVEIFSVFSDDYQTLPDQLRSKEWLKFLRQLGLKETLSKDEFLKLCKKVATTVGGGHCSDTLIKYLFVNNYQTHWSRDGHFLKQVSNIPFAYTYNASSVSWITPGIISRANQLVRLNGTTLCSSIGSFNCRLNKHLAWTVKPLIEFHFTDPLTSQNETQFLLESLGIVYKPAVSDVIANIQNIYKQSRYADESFFNKFPDSLLPPDKNYNILDILYTNLSYLDRCKHRAGIEVLAECPCIPVHCDLLSKDKKKMVLVKPSRVILSGDSSVTKYHPILHSLPDKLHSEAQLFTEIGGSQSLNLHHMQIVLEWVFSHSSSKKLGDDPNTRRFVPNAIEFLKENLPYASDESAATSLTPLYLPDSKDELKNSKDMLYCDSTCRIQDIDLTGTPYSHFDIRKISYGVSALEFCRLLPENVRPLRMSEKCRQIPDPDCETVEHCDMIVDIQKSLQDENSLSVISQAYKLLIDCKTSQRELNLIIQSYFLSFKIITKRNLKMQLVLKESNKKIGNVLSDFHLESTDTQHVLYVDFKFQDEEDIVDEVVNNLYKEVSRNVTVRNQVSPEDEKKLLTFVKKYLRAKDSERKQWLVSRIGLDSAEVIPKTVSFECKCGEEIPESHQAWLKQDPHNIFNPMEYVGYEDKDGHIIVAQVVRLVNSVEDNQLTKMYLIFTGIEDNEGVEVSILDLYKFIQSTMAEDGENTALIHSTTQHHQESLNEDDLTEIKESIRRELNEIWKLDVGLRNKAVKRLYLKWHPDKNLDNLERATEVFTFLQEQVRLLEEESDEDDQNAPRTSNLNSSFPTWNRRASSHRSAHATGSPSYSPFDHVRNPRNAGEGSRWVKQAVVEYSVLEDIHSKAAVSCGYGYVCFMAHQVAEKALKGGVYALCGMDRGDLRDHDLIRHAEVLHAINPHQTKDLVRDSSSLNDYYLNTRYPNRCPYPKIPADCYDSDKANEAKDCAKAVLDSVKSIMP